MLIYLLTRPISEHTTLYLFKLKIKSDAVLELKIDTFLSYQSVAMSLSDSECQG